MSARVRAGSQQPARGGDGRRRAWSESPIPRVATRRVKVGAPSAWTLTIRPDRIATALESDHDPTYVGGGGQNTLKDESDSTYLTLDYDSGTGEFGAAVATLEATALPGSTITAATLTFRVRTSTAARFSSDVALDILGGNTYDPFILTCTEDPASGWTDYTYSATSATDFGTDANWYMLPTVAMLEAGTVEMILNCANTGGGSESLDVSDIWMTVSGTA